MTSRPLGIIILGAGIAGLYAGIALKKAGHKVEVRILHIIPIPFFARFLTHIMVRSTSLPDSQPRQVLRSISNPMQMDFYDELV